MSSSGSVVLALQMGASTKEVVRLGVEFARIYERPVNAVFVEPPAALSACELTQTHGSPLRSSMIEVMVARERARARAAFEAEARRARVGHFFEAKRAETERALEHATSPGDLAVLSVDLSDRRDDRLLTIADRLRSRRVGALFVPETAVATRGDVVASDAALRSDELITKLARNLAARVVVAPPPEATGVNVWLPELGPSLDLGAVAPMFLVLTAGHAVGAHLAAALGELRRHRAALLLLADPVSS